MGAREALLGAKVPTEEVRIASIGQTFFVRGMTGAERDKYEFSFVKKTGRKAEYVPENMRAKLVAFCTVDEHGQRIFSDADAALLGETRADVLDALFSVAQRLSGIGAGDADELGLSSDTKTITSTPSSPSQNVSI